MKAVTIRSNQIECDGCIAAVRRSLGRVAGVLGVEGRPEAQEVEVRFDESTIGIPAILAAMADAGFPGEPVG